MAELHLLRAHADEVRRILRRHLPDRARVCAFGSRATGRGLKSHSDLDLLIDSPDELPLSAMADLGEALTESNLPFAVDLLDRRDASAGFLAQLQNEGRPRHPRTRPLRFALLRFWALVPLIKQCAP